MGLFFLSNTSTRSRYSLLLILGGYVLIGLSIFILYVLTVYGIIRAPRRVQIDDDQIVLFFVRGGRKVVPMGSVADLVVPKEDKDSWWRLSGVLGVKGQRKHYSITHEAARTILARYTMIFGRAPPVPDWYHDAYNPDGTEKGLWRRKAAP
jgi:alpha-glucosidase (family GH31 glycosyl hydrolase)